MGITTLSAFQENNKDCLLLMAPAWLLSLSHSSLIHSPSPFLDSVPSSVSLLSFHLLSHSPCLWFPKILLPFPLPSCKVIKRGPWAPGLNCCVWHHWIFRSQRQQLQSDLAGHETQSAEMDSSKNLIAKVWDIFAIHGETVVNSVYFLFCPLSFITWTNSSLIFMGTMKAHSHRHKGDLDPKTNQESSSPPKARSLGDCVPGDLTREGCLDGSRKEAKHPEVWLSYNDNPSRENF